MICFITGIIIVAGLGVLGWALWMVLSPFLERHHVVERLYKSIERRVGPPPSPSTQVHPPPEHHAVRVSFGPESAQAAQQAGLDWLGLNEVFAVQGVTIPDPLTYRLNMWAGRARPDEPSAIDPLLPVADRLRGPEEPLPYWPSYSGSTPGQRRLYLEWMASGRRTLPSEIGYAFIFFYGLERRGLVDEADQIRVVNEAFRLKQINAAHPERYNRSFDSYSSSFLWYMVMSFAQRVLGPSMRVLVESTRLWDEDSLSAALAWFVLNDRPLPAWAAFVVAGQLPESRRSVVTQRVGGEFQRLFETRYAERFPEGLKLRSSKRDRLYSYRPASSALSTFSRRGPNPLGLRSQFKALSEIWNACIDDLRRLSTVVVKEGGAALTPAAWEAMPSEIRAGVEHPLTDAVCKLVDECTDDQGRTMIKAERIAAVAGYEPRERLTLARSRNVCEAFEHVGYGLVPDARLTGKGYRADETLGAFLRTMAERADPVRWSAASCMLRLGFGVAGADGHVDPEEVGVITDTVQQVFDLNAEEQRRLKVLRDLLLAEGQDLRGLSRLTKSLSPEKRQAIAKLLLLVIARDGVVTKDEVRALGRCYTSLGFGQEEVRHALDAVEMYRAGGPVTIQARVPGAPGEAIPVPWGEVTEVRLDREAIAAIMRDTREVAQMLATAMSSEGEEPVPEAPPIQAQETVAHRDKASEVAVHETLDPAIPPQYAAFYEVLITRDEWSRAEVDARAREQGLMLSGAIDGLNDWAYGKYGGPLFVEDGENLFVQREYLD